MTPVNTQTDRQAPVHELTAQDVADIERIGRQMCAAGPDGVDHPDWTRAAREHWDDLPATLRRAVRAFRRDSGENGCLLLRGIPVGSDDTIPATPMVADSVQRTPTVAAAVLLMLACGLGDPMSFQAEKHGALVHDVVPVPGKEEFQGNAGSVPLSFHNENAFHQHRPDLLMLLCLRADHEQVARLTTSCIRTALPLLGEDSRRTLFSDEFVTERPPSFAAGEPTSPHPVLFGAQDDPDLRVDLAATTPLTARAEAALADLDATLTRTACSAKLGPGDLAIVDNRVTVHGRSAFTPRYDGADRWLQRTFVATDLRRSRDHRPQDGYVLTR